MSNDLKSLCVKDSLRYVVCDDEQITSADWESVTIDTCRIIKCQLQKCSLINADIIGTTFTGCTTEKVDFSHTDICTLIVRSTSFISDLFDISTIRDCEFSDCEFDSCSFEHAAMTHNKFINCTFNNITINQSSSYLNEFISCTFINCSFKGNFFYSSFINCNTQTEFLSTRLLGYNILLPSRACIAEPDYLSKLKDKKMFLNIEIYKLNTNNINSDTFIYESLIAIHQLISNDILVRSEQLEFIQMITTHYIKCNQLSTFSILQAITIIDSIFEESKKDLAAFLKAKDNLNLLKNILFLEYVNRINNLPALTIDYTHSQPCTYKITYEHEPEIEISKIINSVLDKMGIQSVKAVRISTEKGSFIEVIEFIQEAQPLIQILLSIATGVVVPLIVNKNKTSSSKPAKSQNAVEQSQATQPTIINNYYITQNQTIINNCVSCTMQVFAENDITASTNFKGYSRDNVRTIEKL